MSTSNNRLIRKKVLAEVRDEIFTLQTELLNLQTKIHANFDEIKVSQVDLYGLKGIRVQVQALQQQIDRLNIGINEFVKENPAESGWHSISDPEEGEQSGIGRVLIPTDKAQKIYTKAS